MHFLCVSLTHSLTHSLYLSIYLPISFSLSPYHLSVSLSLSLSLSHSHYRFSLFCRFLHQVQMVAAMRGLVQNIIFLWHVQEQWMIFLCLQYEYRFTREGFFFFSKVHVENVQFHLTTKKKRRNEAKSETASQYCHSLQLLIAILANFHSHRLTIACLRKDL